MAVLWIDKLWRHHLLSQSNLAALEAGVPSGLAQEWAVARCCRCSWAAPWDRAQSFERIGANALIHVKKYQNYVPSYNNSSLNPWSFKKCMLLCCALWQVQIDNQCHVARARLVSRRNAMKGRGYRAPTKLPVVLGKVLLRWIFTKADLVFFVYRFVVIYDKILLPCIVSI